MKVNSAFLSMALAGFLSLSAAQPHGKIHHRHHPRRDLAEHVVELVTVWVDQFGNKVTPTAGGSPKETAGIQLEAVSSTREKFYSQVTSSSSVSSASPTRSFDHISSSSAASSSSAPAPSQSQSEPKVPDDIVGGGKEKGTEDVSGGSGVDSDFPDGELDCGTLPTQYGAVSVDWVTTQGWSGIQTAAGGNGDSVGKCSDGDLCSYACPPGYSKAQYPSDQPASGESHGGLLCKGGKLHLTRKDYPKLCQKGVGTATVKNQLSQQVPICRTDYPGSENMVVPLKCGGGSTSPLTVPDASNSYNWQGKPTSAQYYVNPAGTSMEDGCTWNTEGSGKGNWSPIVLGAGYSQGKTWLSISQNQLNSDKLNFNIKIVAADGGNLSGDCKYENGQFTGQGAGNGCTVALTSGDAQFVLYD